MPWSSLALMRALKGVDRDIEQAVRQAFLVPTCLDESDPHR